MRLIVQPNDGSEPLLKAIRSAKKSIDIVIFRFDHKEIERALMDAVRRGVAVRALIAFTNKGGEKNLRGLEARLLAAGAVVARTADDLIRYHGKFIIVDRSRLYLLCFNFTNSDIKRTRSFGAVVTNTRLVQEALKLFGADMLRQPYSPGLDAFVVSPLNARSRLAQFIGKARKELLIYDPQIGDPEMIQLLKKRAEAGVDVRIIGTVKPRPGALRLRSLNSLRLHARVIVQDRNRVFMGSQSLRAAELDARREVGVILGERTIADTVAKIFESDWSAAKEDTIPAEKVAKKIAKSIAKELGPVAPVLEEVAAKNGKDLNMDRKDLEKTVKEAVKTAVRDVVHEVVAEKT